MINDFIAYFSMEIALEPGMPTYSGGLGVLAGDTIRSAADLKLPMVAVTLVHRQGYFAQKLDADGWQTEAPVAWMWPNSVANFRLASRPGLKGGPFTWIEGCIEGVTGWAIDGVAQGKETKNRTSQEVQSLYQKLGQVVTPAFYQQRDDWLRVMRHAIALNASHFNTQRMVQQYVVKAYFK